MLETLETELTDFIWDNYRVVQAQLKKEQIEALLRQYSDRVIIVRELGDIKGIGFYLRLTDETFKQIREGVFDTTKIENAKICLDENGNNIFFAFVVADSFKTVMKGLRQVIENEKPKTVSWYSFDRKIFHNYRVGGKNE